MVENERDDATYMSVESNKLITGNEKKKVHMIYLVCPFRVALSSAPRRLGSQILTCINFARAITKTAHDHKHVNMLLLLSISTR